MWKQVNDCIWHKSNFLVSLQAITQDLTNLGNKLSQIEKNIKLIPKIEGVERDAFHAIIPDAITHCRQEYEKIQALFEDTIHEFQKTAELFGENSKIIQPEHFFVNISQFISLFQVEHQW